MVKIETISPVLRNPSKLVIRLMLEVNDAEGVCLLSGGRIEQSEHVLYWFNGPFGHHISYHDADDKHPKGRIHQRVDLTKGTFFTLPGNKVLGNEAHWWGAPEFAGIANLHLVPPHDMVASAKGSLIQSLGQPTRHKVDHVLSIPFPENADWILGLSLVLLLPGCELSLKEWCESQARIWEKDGLAELKTWMFDSLRPQVAVMVGWLTS
jgi:hypothetical protein